MYEWCSYRYIHPEASPVGQDMVKAVKVLQRFYRLKKYRRGHGAMGPWVNNNDLTSRPYNVVPHSYKLVFKPQ